MFYWLWKFPNGNSSCYFPHYILNYSEVAMYLWRPKDHTTIHKTQHYEAVVYMGSYNFSVVLWRSCNHMRKVWLVNIPIKPLVAFKNTINPNTQAWFYIMYGYNSNCVCKDFSISCRLSCPFLLTTFFLWVLWAITLHHKWAKLRLLFLP